jgi:PRTRC genetic system protein B
MENITHQRLKMALEFYDCNVVRVVYDPHEKRVSETPISMNQLIEDLKSVQTKPEDLGLIEPGVIINGDPRTWGTLAYYDPPQVRKIRIMKKKMTVPCPGALFVVKPDMLRVFALRHFPGNPETRLFRMPFPNIDAESGRVCTGNADFPPFLRGNMAAIVDSFYGSPFSNHSIVAKSVTYRKDVTDLWNSLEGHKSFPAAELIGSNGPKFIDDLIRGK